MFKHFFIFSPLACHYTCDTCIGPRNTDCIYCAGNRGNNITKTPINQVCGCPDGFYDFLKPFCEGKFIFSHNTRILTKIFFSLRRSG